MIYFIVPFIVLIIWHVFGYFSDDASAIESLQSVESVNENNNEEKQEDVVRKSKQNH